MAHKPHWASLGPAEFGRAFVLATTESELEEFLVSPIDESVGPQIRVCQLDSNPFAVALKMNHMICDAADFKQYLYFLCKVYSELAADPTLQATRDKRRQKHPRSAPTLRYERQAQVVTNAEQRQ